MAKSSKRKVKNFNKSRIYKRKCKKSRRRALLSRVKKPHTSVTGSNELKKCDYTSSMMKETALTIKLEKNTVIGIEPMQIPKNTNVDLLEAELKSLDVTDQKDGVVVPEGQDNVVKKMDQLSD